MYEYRVKIVKVVDGDTVDVDIDLGFGVWLKKQRVRLFGIDTPESRTRDLDEKRYGLMAKKFLTEQIQDGAILKTRLDGKGKYGRILGEVLVNPWDETKQVTPALTYSVNDLLVENHHAVPYFGKSKEEIADLHIRNRTFFDK